MKYIQRTKVQKLVALHDRQISKEALETLDRKLEDFVIKVITQTRKGRISAFEMNYYNL